MVLRARRQRIVTTVIASAVWILLSAACASGTTAKGRVRRQLETTGTVHIPAGVFLMGSTLDERAAALELAYAGHGRVIPEATAWLRQEYRQTSVDAPEFWIMENPVTQGAYLDYVRATGRPEPYVDAQTWARQDLRQPYSVVERVAWARGIPAPTRFDHPVVLVSQAQAADYCTWWGAQRDGVGRLPSEAQWEKAARGPDGRAYPWGPDYEPGHLNAADAGPGDTVEVGSFQHGASPYGALDMAGNVFEWTRTQQKPGTPAGPYQAQGPEVVSFVVKGGAYSTYGHASRAAARHFRPAGLRHVIIGFRCVLELPDDGKSKPKPRRKSAGEGKGNSEG